MIFHRPGKLCQLSFENLWKKNIKHRRENYTGISEDTFCFWVYNFISSCKMWLHGTDFKSFS